MINKKLIISGHLKKIRMGSKSSSNTYSGQSFKNYSSNFVSGGAVMSGTNAVSGSLSNSSGSSRADNSGRQRAKEREEILNMKINGALIGWETLTNKTNLAYKISNSALGNVVKGAKASIIPGKMGGGIYLYHAAIYVYEDYYSPGAIIEYGLYYDDDGLSSGHEKPCHYWNKNGLRFSRMKRSYFQDKFIKENKSLNNKTIEVNVGYSMTVKELLNKVTEYNPFQSRNYSAGNNNCQDFVGRCIKELNITRKEGQDYRGIHSLAKTQIPYQLLVYLEAEEGDGANFIGHVPVVGLGIDSLRGIGRDIKRAFDD